MIVGVGGKEGDMTTMIPESPSAKPVVVLFDVDYTFFNTGRFRETNLGKYELYEGEAENLEELAQIADLGIFSQEAPNISQMRKLEETGVRKLFPDHRIHLYADKLSEIRGVFEKYKGRKKIVLVDDKLSVLMEAKRVNPDIVAIWINRGPYAQAQPAIEGFTPDHQVQGLTELAPLVRSICAEFSERTTLGGVQMSDKRGA